MEKQTKPSAQTSLTIWGFIFPLSTIHVASLLLFCIYLVRCIIISILFISTLSIFYLIWFIFNHPCCIVASSCLFLAFISFMLHQCIYVYVSTLSIFYVVSFCLIHLYRHVLLFERKLLVNKDCYHVTAHDIMSGRTWYNFENILYIYFKY